MQYQAGTVTASARQVRAAIVFPMAIHSNQRTEIRKALKQWTAAELALVRTQPE
jgi:hypothetical protein